MSQILTEIKRNLHIDKTKASDNYDNQSKGRNRYFRRMYLRIDKSVAHLNRMDMNKLFSLGILDINLDVHGETNTYTVRISFGSFLKELHNEVKSLDDRFSLAVVNRALIKAFNTDDVLVRCSCPDFVYRQSFWLSMNGGIAGEMETRPSEITNPNDTKGSGCKHILLVLSNNSWLARVARVIYNYVNYMQVHFEGLYAEVIYPAIYEKEYDDVYQLDLSVLMDKDKENDDLSNDTDMIDTSNKWAREKNKFKPGNEYRIKPDTTNPDLINLNLENTADDINTTTKNFDIDSVSS